MVLDSTTLDSLLSQASESPRLRMNLDLRTQTTCPEAGLPADGSQRMLNAMLPGTVLPIHRHLRTTEVLVMLRGAMEEIYYDAEGRETERILLSAGGPVQGLSIPAGQWHGINVLEPTVILECKDGAYEPLGPEDKLEL